MKKKKSDPVRKAALVLDVLSVACAVAALSVAVKKRIDEKKKKEAEIEAEITAIIENKFAEVNAEASYEPGNEGK